MIKSYSDFWLRGFDFAGRSSRKDFWFATLMYALVTIVIKQVDNGALLQLYYLVTLIPGFSLYVRRLHDRGQSGWWVLLVISIIGAPIVLIFAALPGQVGENKYGLDPNEVLN